MKKLVMVLAAAMALLLLAACGAPASSESLAPSSASVAPVSSSELPAASSDSQSEEIRAMENRPAFDSAEMWAGGHPEALQGGWQASQSMGSGPSERFLFLEDGTFYFTGNTMSYRNRLRYMDGGWRYENGTLCLEVHRKVVIEGGKLAEGSGRVIDYIKGGVYRKYEFASGQYENLELPVDIVDSGEGFDYLDSVLLNGEQYWNAGGVGYTDMPEAWDWFEDMESSDKDA